jgi:3-dehydroquinate synthase
MLADAATLDRKVTARVRFLAMPTVPVRLKAREQSYEIKVGPDLLSSLGSVARECLGAATRRVAVISNETVFNLYGKRALQSLRAADFTINQWLTKDGEQHKTVRSLEQALAFLSTAGFERTDAIVALGGGVVGDLAGFVAATYMRGLPFIQVPTSLLAQIDASVGGKVAVNLPAGKNLVGAFYQPRLVLIDTETLRTLPPRELTAGWCEAVKQGAVGDRKLFDRTVRLLRGGITPGADNEELSATIAAHCRFKAAIVAGDEREAANRDDARSRKILNFGHTTAHALEAVTGYKRFRHGEAVGHGMLVAGEISKNLGTLPTEELESLRQAVRLCGPLPAADDIDIGRIISAMKGDKKSVGGSIKWVLLSKIGQGRIVDGREVRPAIVRKALRAGLRRGR